MSYFVTLGNRLLTKLITYGVLLHLTICVGTISGFVVMVLSVIELTANYHLTNLLAEQGEERVVSLVDRQRETWQQNPNGYLCFLGIDDFIVPYLRSTPPKNTDSLRILYHPDLITPINPRTVEIGTTRPDRTLIFKTLQGHNFILSIARLAAGVVLIGLGFWISIGGFFAIKRGALRKKYRK